MPSLLNQESPVLNNKLGKDKLKETGSKQAPSGDPALLIEIFKIRLFPPLHANNLGSTDDCGGGRQEGAQGNEIHGAGTVEGVRK